MNSIKVSLIKMELTKLNLGSETLVHLLTPLVLKRYKMLLINSTTVELQALIISQESYINMENLHYTQH